MSSFIGSSESVIKIEFKPVHYKWFYKAFKSQISSIKYQTNLKPQYSMTKTTTNRAPYITYAKDAFLLAVESVWNLVFDYWDLFEICFLVLGILSISDHYSNYL